MIRNWLKPDWEPCLGIPNLPIEHLLDIGIKAIVLDVDGTLIPRNETNLHESVKLWIERAKVNLDLHLLSNNPSKKRIKYISNQLNLDFTYNAAKPSSKALRKALLEFNQDSKRIAIVGDRIFTDILVGNRLGLYTILVRPLDGDGKIKANSKFQKFEKSIAALFGASQQ